MLVLTRNRNQEIVILTGGDEPIVIKVADIRGDKVRLGITAPGMIIHRKEVWERVKHGS